MINLGIGQPSDDLLPVELIRKATEVFFASAQPQDLNYGPREGDLRFRASLAKFLCRNYGRPVDSEALFLTGGNSQALDMACSHFSRPGDTIFVEEPSYFLAYQIFTDHGLNIVSVPVDHEGLDIDALEATIATTKPTLLYTIPSYQNPTGRTMSFSRRKRLVELSRKHDFMILADEVYQVLSFTDSPPDAIGTMADSGNVCSLGSFSKILAPGLRLGWIQTTRENVRRLNRSGAVSSGGSLNHFTSHIVRHAIDMGLLQSHLHQLRLSYRNRVAVMDYALNKYLSRHATWTRPHGGYFFWLTMENKNSNTQKLLSNARKAGVGFQPGELFSSTGGMADHIRLSFARYDENGIQEGIARLASVIK